MLFSCLPNNALNIIWSFTCVTFANSADFGIELGFVEADYNFVKSFPYNVLPHPMILSQVLALLGFFKVPHMHCLDLACGGVAASGIFSWILPGPGSGLDGWGWLIPVHIALYFIHMTQEIFDVWKGDPWYKKK